MTQVVSLAVPTILVLLLFYWNVSQIILTADNPEKRKQALPRLLWSIVALFVIFSLGGIINIISETLLGSNGASSSSPASQTAGTNSAPIVPRGTTRTPAPTSPTPTPPGSTVTPTPTPTPTPPGSTVTPTPRPQPEPPERGFFQI
ncbi:hypothetical protein EPO56_03750 [Patescibacteria group bacterium]|nr:MAG: hypothetical protein EPO56_03750 [Patescibacteria group bacterium]